MKKRLIKVALYLIFLMVIIYTESCKESKPLTEEQKVQKCIEDNVTAANVEDIDSYMNTLSTKGPDYQMTKQQIQMAFQAYEVEIQILNMDIHFVSDSEAVSSVVQSIISRTPPGPPTQIVIKNKLIKENGDWKIFKSHLMK